MIHQLNFQESHLFQFRRQKHFLQDDFGSLVKMKCANLSKRSDLQNHLFLSNGKPNKRQLFESIEEQYKGIFTPYKNLNPITRWFMKYTFQFVPFSTGTFNKVASGQQVYTPGEDMDPRELWKAILKTVKG